MPLKTELYNPAADQWVALSVVDCGDPPGSLSDNRDGHRQLYVFSCAPNDCTSTIYRSRLGVDAATPVTREIQTTGLDTVKELRRGDDPFELTVQPDNMPFPLRVRFTQY